MGFGVDILVIKKNELFKEDYFQGFKEETDKTFLNRIINKSEFKLRNEELESDKNTKQPIPYLWIINPKTKHVFAYKRAPDERYTEKRLRDKWSCGIGGHVDKPNEKDPTEKILLDSIRRELEEEVNMKTYPNPKIIGYINDDSNEVGKVHFGIVAIVETEEEVTEGDDEMVYGKLYSIEELEQLFSSPENEIETWTMLSWPCIKSYLLQ